MNIPSVKIENFVVPAKKENGKACMKSIWLDVEGQRMLATNGHMAARVSIGVDTDDVSGLIPVEAFELARKELKAILKVVKDALPDPWLKVTAGEDSVIIQNLMSNTTHLVTRPKLVADEKYPAVDAVFPELTKNPNVSLNMDYVGSIVKSLEQDSITVSLWTQGEDKSVVMAAPSGNAVVVLMPMRAEVSLEEINLRGTAKSVEVAEVPND